MIWTEKQKDYINNSNKRWNIKVGATGTGKTYVDQENTILRRVMELKGKQGLFLLIGVTTTTLQRNILTPMRARYGKALIGEYNKSTGQVSMFGQIFEVIGAEKENATNKIQGATVVYIYGDEFVDWNETFFKMLTTRLRVEGAVADLTGNPKQPSHWAKKFIDKMVEKDLCYYQTSTIYDNPMLPKEFVKSQEIELAGTTEYMRLLLGQWAIAEGAIYGMLNRDKHIITNWEEKDDNGIYVNELRQRVGNVFIGVDIGGSKSKTTFSATAVIPSKTQRNRIDAIVTIKENKFIEERDPTYIETELIKFIEDLERQGYKLNRVDVDSAEQVITRGIHKAIRNSGRPLTVKACFKQPIIERIRLYQKLLNLGKYQMLDTCPMTFEAFQNAVWNEKSKKDERLDDFTSDIDMLDSQEYSTSHIFKLLELI